MGYKTFTAEALLAADVNNYFMRQVVIRVANNTARNAIPSPVEGMVCYVESTNRFEWYTGSAWIPLLPTGNLYGWADTTARNAQTGMSVGEYGLQLDTHILYRYTGSAWKAWESEWESYVPTLGGLAVGTGGSINTAEWRYFGGRIQVRGRAKLGSSGASVSGTITLSLPVNCAALNHSWQNYKGMATLYDDSGGTNYIAFIAANVASVSTVALLSPGTNGLRLAHGATTPFTWAVSDMVTYDFEYDPA